MDLGGPRHPPPSVKLRRCPWCKRAKTVLCWQVHYPQEDPTSPSFPRAVKSLLGDTKPDLSSPEPPDLQAKGLRVYILGPGGLSWALDVRQLSDESESVCYTQKSRVVTLRS